MGIIDGSLLRFVHRGGETVGKFLFRSRIGDDGCPFHVVESAVACFLGTALHAEVDSISFLDGDILCRCIIGCGVALGNFLVPEFRTAFLNGYAHTVCMGILIRIIIPHRGNQADCTGDADGSILGSLPDTHHVLHRRGFNQFCLLGRVYLDDRGVYLAAVDNRTRRIGTAQGESWNGIAGFIELYMIEINLSARYKVYQTIAVDVGEVFRCLGFGRREINTYFCRE